MSALESLNLSISYFHISSSSPTPKLHFFTKSKLSVKVPTLTPKVFLKTPFAPISRKLNLCSLSTIRKVAEQEQDEEDETQKEDNKRKLFVVGLPWSFTVSDVKNFFGECGTVADVEIIKREDGKRGFAFVTMSSGEEALDVVNRFNSHIHLFLLALGSRVTEQTLYPTVKVQENDQETDIKGLYHSLFFYKLQELSGRILKVEYAKKFKKPTPRSPTSLRWNETRHKLFVSNLAWKVRTTNLKQFFADFNPVSTRVVFSPSGSSAGYGFISFASKEEADAALLALNEKELLGRPISLKFSEKSTDKSDVNEENKNHSEEHHDAES